MRKSEKDGLLQVLNASGFPFQQRIAEEISRNPGTAGWRVYAQEHYWQFPRVGSAGFIDIVAGYGIVRLVIECKRGAGADWLFLAPKDAKDVHRVRTLCTDRQPDEPDITLWADLSVRPASPEAGFCIVRGQADKEPMLERIGASLVESVEALAEEELALGRSSPYGTPALYVPVLVTAARLQLARFDPGAVSLDLGKLADADVEFQGVPAVRLRKQLGRGSDTDGAWSLEDAQRENERSVLIVQANALKSVVEDFHMWAGFSGAQWPQIAERQKLRAAPR